MEPKSIALNWLRSNKEGKFGNMQWAEHNHSKRRKKCIERKYNGPKIGSQQSLIHSLVIWVYFSTVMMFQLYSSIQCIGILDRSFRPIVFLIHNHRYNRRWYDIIVIYIKSICFAAMQSLQDKWSWQSLQWLLHWSIPLLLYFVKYKQLIGCVAITSRDLCREWSCIILKPKS